MAKANEDVLSTLHGVLAEEFIRRIKSGEAKPADLAAAAKFLKDNNIECTPEAGLDRLKEVMNGLKDELPFTPGELHA